MIKLKNLAWASALSAAIIAIIYDNDIAGQRGSSRFRGSGTVEFPSHSAGVYGQADRSAYQRAPTTSHGIDLSRSPAAPEAIRLNQG